MAQLRFLYHKDYNFNRRMPLVRQVHGSVLNKPAQIRRKLIELGVATAKQFESPGTLSEAQLLAIHSDEVVASWKSAKSIAAVAESPPMGAAPAFVARALLLKPQLRASAGTSMALDYACQGDWVFNLSGGFHHARPGLAHGFCLMNDLGWAVHCLGLKAKAPRILVLDLDLHQGDGNAAFFAENENIFTASLHQEDTFPEPKIASDLDLGLAGGTANDERYLSAVDEVIAGTKDRFTPEVIVYVAGTDPYKDDIVGEFDVSADGLRERDLRVARLAREQGAGLVVLPAGGYSPASPELAARGMAAIASEFSAAK